MGAATQHLLQFPVSVPLRMLVLCTMGQFEEGAMAQGKEGAMGQGEEGEMEQGKEGAMEQGKEGALIHYHEAHMRYFQTGVKGQFGNQTLDCATNL